MNRLLPIVIIMFSVSCFSYKGSKKVNVLDVIVSHTTYGKIRTSLFLSLNSFTNAIESLEVSGKFFGFKIEQEVSVEDLIPDENNMITPLEFFMRGSDEPTFSIYSHLNFSEYGGLTELKIKLYDKKKKTSNETSIFIDIDKQGDRYVPILMKKQNEENLVYPVGEITSLSLKMVYKIPRNMKIVDYSFELK